MKHFLNTCVLFLLGIVTYAQQIPTTIGHIDNKPVMMRHGQPVLFAGIQYWGLDSWNMNNWDADIEEFKALGLNGIRLNIAWDHIETAEGVFNFTQLDALLNKLDKAGLMVYLQFSQSAHEWKPQWFENKYAEADLLAYDNHGEKQYNRYSFASPYLKEHYTSYIVNTIDHIKNHSCIVAYSVYTEPHFADKEQLMDYNKHNRVAFITWLKERYTTIDNLNTAWNSSYSSFDKVKPYGSDVPENWETINKKKKFADWRIWNCVVKARFIGGLIEEAKKVDSNHLYGQNMMWKWSAEYFDFVSLDPELNYEYADLIGINVYPTTSNTEKMGNSVNFIRELHQNNKVVWLGEMNAKPGNATKKNLKKFLGGAFDAGCTGFVYFTYNGNAEGGIDHYGVMLNGQRKDSWYELQNYISDIIKDNEAIILSQPLPEVECYMLWPFANKYATVLDGNYVLTQHTALRTMLYHNNGLEIATLSEQQFIDGNFDKSKPIVIPSMPITNQLVGEKIKEYATAGSAFLICGRFGEFYWTDKGQCLLRDNNSRDANIGIKFNSVIPGPCNDQVNVLKPFYDISESDLNIQPVKDIVSFEVPKSAEVIARWDNSNEAAIISYPLEAGKIMYFGTHLLTTDYKNNLEFNSRLMTSFIKWANNSIPQSIDNASKKKAISINISIEDYLLTVESEIIANVQLYNLAGQLLKNLGIVKPGITSFNISSGASSGIYIVKVQNERFESGYKIYL